MNRLRTASASLVTLTAPAGYGKTTLAAQWAERERRPVAWLTVDEADDDVARLLEQLAMALGRLEGRADKPAVRRRKEWTDELARLASRLSSSEDFVLVVDNAQLLRSRNATKALSTLAEHVPAGSTLALVGRLTPGLPIARLRADGKLLELQAGELALSRREGEALLRALDAGLAADDGAELLERCEGWAAGIRLGALAAGDDDRAVSGGDDRFLAEYIRSEFLPQLTPDLLTFLRRTSVLEHLTAPVCDAVLERTGSGRVLAALGPHAPAARSARPARRGLPLSSALPGPARTRAERERARARRRSSTAGRRTGSRHTATSKPRSSTPKGPPTPTGWLGS